MVETKIVTIAAQLVICYNVIMSTPQHESPMDPLNGEVYNPTNLVNRIVVPEGVPRYSVLQTLSQKIPANEYGLPSYFLRHDLLPYDFGTLTEGDVEAAAEGLFYEEGYPTLSTGTTFWHQLPHETYEDYLLFTRYIEQAEEVGIRQLDLLAVSIHEELTRLQERYHLYYWSARARAHDMFIVAADQKKRYLRTSKMEDKHFNTAAKLLDALMTKFDDPEWIEELNAKEAIEALETLAKIQRLSVGLTGQHASSTSKDQLPAGAPVESIMRNITRQAGLSNATQEAFGDRLAALMSNPEDGMAIQATILKVTQSHTGKESENIL